MARRSNTRPGEAEGGAQPALPGKPDTARPTFSRAEWTADILRERILQGTYPPGERIREAELQAEFGFSNGPIREALQMLVAQGLAERNPFQGVRVVELSDQQLLELFEVRLAVLQYAAELAACHASDEVLATGEALRARLAAAFDAAQTSGQRLSFTGELSHWLLEAAGNDTMRRIWDQTVAQSQIYVNASMRRGAGGDNRRLVDALIVAVMKRDVEAARAVARDLTRRTLADLGLKGRI
ncbi:GntR family transcriptional regulator [Roseomonas marmotae]|uniref:GntR family transcriptional regulator n=1 Tax=Roseomonas marmotae TaxID=2768161 RepID=A0ABS3K7U7_9PROT|nr:GntR family transcriptional regulator [Roseomonas marmotae]MBO1073500.1 GntR family transcriptional regulator [Roseomonas marmotae]QTI80311.1 GntR family transcriptional regulator [Roseomonas marmotae]